MNSPAATRGLEPLPLPEGFAKFDLRRAKRVAKDRLVSVQAVAERMGSALEVFLSGLEKGPVKVVLKPIEQTNFGEYVEALTRPCAAYIYDLGDDVGHRAILELGQVFSVYLMDRTLGGSGKPYPKQGSLTDVEQETIRPAAERVMRIFADMWRDLVRFQPRQTKVQTTPEVIDAANHEDPVLTFRYAMTAGEVDAEFTLCLPLSAVDRAVAGTASRLSHARHINPRSAAADRAAIETTLRRTPIEMMARLPAFRISMAEYRSLRRGQFLYIGSPADTMVEVVCDGTILLRGVKGRHGRHAAVSIMDTTWLDSHALPPTLAKGKLMQEKNSNPGAAEEISMDSLEAVVPDGDAPLSRMPITLPGFIVVGKVRLPIDEFLHLKRGSVLQLDRLVGEPAEFFVGDEKPQKIADGEVIALNEQLHFQINRVYGSTVHESREETA